VVPIPVSHAKVPGSGDKQGLLVRVQLGDDVLFVVRDYLLRLAGPARHVVDGTADIIERYRDHQPAQEDAGGARVVAEYLETQPERVDRHGRAAPAATL
jgi:hypothetical protein